MASMNTVLFLFVFLTATLLTDVYAEDEPCSPDDLTCMEQADDPCAGGNCPPDESANTCPPDSYQVMEGLNNTRCACKPCPTSIEKCESPLKLKLIHSARREPGSCCDKYECTLREVCGNDGDENNQEGASWMKDPCTRCNCRGGYSYCEQISDCHSQDFESFDSHLEHMDVYEDFGEGPSGCFALGSLKQNGDKWREGPCTECVCEEGRRKCTQPQCKSDCERPTVLLAGECCPVCPSPCPQQPACEGPDMELTCSAPDLFGCSQCTCRYNRVELPMPPTQHVPTHIHTTQRDFLTLAVAVAVVICLLGIAVGSYCYYVRRNRGRRIVNNSHAVYDEKLSLFDVKLRPADGQQTYRPLGTNNVDHV